MWLFYVIACIPAGVGAFLWFSNRKVVWWEWLAGTAVAFLVSTTVHYTVAASLTNDSEVWSGQIDRAVHYPRWVEEYEVAVYRTETYTDSNGNVSTRQVFSHYETRYRTHPEHWEAECTLGCDHSIKKVFFEEIRTNFGSLETKDGRKSGFYSGDKNIYVSVNKAGFLYPTNAWRRFENRVKVAPNLFSHVEVPEDAKVYPYPKLNGWRSSNRILGDAKKTVMQLEWDRLNARLGPTKKVNVIMVAFGDRDSTYGPLQEAKWHGGKKNDLVLCYGGPSEDPTWTYVFGWTEQAIVKRNLETILLEGPVDTDLIEPIEEEIIARYELVDWAKFDYIQIDPPGWSFGVLILIMGLTQGGFWVWAHFNDQDKGGRRPRWRRF